MDKNDPRYQNLMRASQVTRQQNDAIQAKLNAMSDDDLNYMLSQDEDLRSMIQIGEDNNNQGIVINYANQPQNQRSEFAFRPPWEGNLSSVPTTPQFQQQNGFFQNNCWGYASNPNDPRIKAYTVGMKLYGINPYAFSCAEDMIGYYEMCEAQRKQQCDLNYVLAKMGINGFDGTYEEAMAWLDTFKFKSAEEIIAEQQRVQQEEAEKKRKELEDCQDTDGEIVYGVYDSRGYKFVRSACFEVVNEAGEVVAEYGNDSHKDKRGVHYKIVTLEDERRKAWEEQQRQVAIYREQVIRQATAEAFRKQLENAHAEYEATKDMPLSEVMLRWENRSCDWEKQAKLIDRVFRTAAYSKRKFEEILADCCNCNLDYAGRSEFFSLSYDFERDLHYAQLTQTEEELQGSDVVMNKFKQEFDIKRKQFMEKCLSGNLGCDMRTDATYHPTTAKPIISELTLEDYQKPENQIMYSQIYTPQLATENMFIPKELGCKLDSNGQPIPSERTVGFMTVDDDTGEVLSKEEYDVPIDASQLTDDNLAEVY